MQQADPHPGSVERTRQAGPTYLRAGWTGLAFVSLGRKHRSGLLAPWSRLCLRRGRGIIHAHSLFLRLGSLTTS